MHSDIATGHTTVQQWDEAEEGLGLSQSPGVSCMDRDTRTISVVRDFNAKIGMHERWQLKAMAYSRDETTWFLDLLYRWPKTSCLGLSSSVSLKLMAAVIYLRYRNRRAIRRNRIFRDRTHPLEIYNDEQIYTKFRFYRHLILQLTDEVRNEIEFVLSRKGSLTPILQVLLTLRFYATGTLQNVIGELLCVDQSTVNRIVNRVTNAFLRRMNRFIVWPDQRKADANKRRTIGWDASPMSSGVWTGHTSESRPRLTRSTSSWTGRIITP